MKPTRISGHTQLIRAPEGWDHSKLPCGDLHIRARRPKDSLPTITSAWLPSPEELEQLNKGCPVLLAIVSNSTMPPVMVTVGTVLDLTPKFTVEKMDGSGE